MIRWLLVIFISTIPLCFAQADEDGELFLNIQSTHKVNYQKVHSDSLSIVKEVNQILGQFYASAYLAASADSMVQKGDTVFVSIQSGPLYKWASLTQGNIPDHILLKSGYKEKLYREKAFSYKDFAKLQQRIIEQSENSGHPFACVKIDSITIEGEMIAGCINFEKGPSITFDSLHIEGEASIKKNFLAGYLQINEGQLYDQSKVDNITRLIRELPYLKQSRPPVVTFRGGKAQVGVFLEDRKVNQVDGIIGFLPNEAEDGKLLLTGEVNLDLKNLFNSGKNLFLEWRRFMQASQVLDVNYYHSRILHSGIDVEGSLNLFKQDSSFINIDRSLSLHHQLNTKGKVTFYSGYRTSRVLSGYPISDPDKLPEMVDYDFISYGGGYSWHNLDDIFYPHKGWRFSATATVGNKIIRKNVTWNEEIYDDVQLRSVQVMLRSFVHKHLPIGKKSVLWFRGEGGMIFNNEDNIFVNDLYRIGGLRSLRGFNENNFYASDYGLATIEYRFFTEETSYLLVFYDQGVVSNRYNEEFKVDAPRSFGVGVSFSSGPGVFNFVYSMGMSRSQPLNLSLAKIHFGFVSRF
ncbi:BamA/TamA family outer membrane protein [Cytophagaceae bacterium ABcell3]|nr:BamA/TamA family outer membrane protein [Cytophagaceae bacterium ABcell3]